MINADALTKYDITDIKTVDQAKASEIRNQIIFKTPSAVANSELNAVSDIQRETRFFEAGGVKNVSAGAVNKILTVGGQVQNESK